MRKRLYVAAAVQTKEALEVCLRERVGLFCIENPLYSELPELPFMEELENYDAQMHVDKQIIVMKRVSGGNEFDDAGYEVLYPPLQWNGQTS